MPSLHDAAAAPAVASPLVAEAARLSAVHAGLGAAELIAVAARDVAPGRAALVTSFGAESAILLHLVAGVDPALPVVFVDTLRLFPETLAYRDDLVARLGLRDVRTVSPSREDEDRLDPLGALFVTDADACCGFRKVEPLARALEPFDLWISGRKRFQAATRSALQPFEADGERLKLNPLADWSASDCVAYLRAHDIPPHPMVALGYPSIGCSPCTTPVAEGEDPRAGRWRGQGKTECGIHLGAQAPIARGA
ncbi:MAG: phosphoadenylyl-sulfate reductase [Alsobacter sp.]